MSKRRADSGASVNLFPFLSILVCIIGCLTLIIVVLNLISMSKAEGREPEEIERAREFALLEKQQEKDQKNYDELRQLVDSLTKQNEELLAKRQKLTLLKEMLESAEKIDASREELIAKFQILSKANKQLDADELVLNAEIESLKKEIEERKLPPEAAQLQVRPSGSGANTQPHFVEIADALLLIHHSMTEPPIEVPAGSIEINEDFRSLLEKVASQPYNTLILLVRGSDPAVVNLGKVRGVIQAFNQQTGSEIIPGRLPLPGEGKVDLTLFEQYLK